MMLNSEQNDYASEQRVLWAGCPRLGRLWNMPVPWWRLIGSFSEKISLVGFVRGAGIDNGIGIASIEPRRHLGSAVI